MANLKCKYIKNVEPLLRDAYGDDKTKKIMADTWARYEELVNENKDEPKAMHIHTRQRIYPAVALFDSLLKEGIERDDAAKFVVDYYKWRSAKVAKFVKFIVGIPGVYKKVPGFFTKMTGKMFGEAAGFKSVNYDVPKNQMKIDMVSCPYNNICIHYGCQEIVTGFCEADDICYANMHPKLKWGRTMTMGQGGDKCDFLITLEE